MIPNINRHGDPSISNQVTSEMPSTPIVGEQEYVEALGLQLFLFHLLMCHLRRIREPQYS